MKKLYSVITFLIISNTILGQANWSLCNAPAFNSRVDDLFMPTAQIGYAVCGDGQIVKTTNGGTDWVQIASDSGIYYRSVEFVSAQKGFVGGFPVPFGSGAGLSNVLKRTDDGGNTWTDLTSQLDTVARQGICGLAAPDSNTIYGCGNWYFDSAYIVKSIDDGHTWSFIDMSSYATSLIDMYFINRDTGFATGKGLYPKQTSIILYTTDGGATWTNKFTNTTSFEYCWKIQHLTQNTYFASIEQFNRDTARILKSIDGGMTWKIIKVSPIRYNIEGIGFIDSLKGWTGGGARISFETTDGGATWDSIPFCPQMNRLFKMNDSLMFATGDNIYRYSSGIISRTIPPARQYTSLKCFPNPVNNELSLEAEINQATRVLILLCDQNGTPVKTIDNADKQKGKYAYTLNTSALPAGIYYILLKTHEDDRFAKITVIH